MTALEEFFLEERKVDRVDDPACQSHRLAYFDRGQVFVAAETESTCQSRQYSNEKTENKEAMYE